jgi:transketolase
LERYVGTDGVAIGMSGFGASAPIDVLYEQFGITTQPMVDEATRLVKEHQR